MKFWLDYIIDISRRMRLGYWHFTLEDKPAPDDAHAHIICTGGRESAVINVCWDWDSLEPEKQRHFVVHELVHALLQPAEDVLNAVWDMQDDSYQHVVTIHRNQIEYSVDSLALIIADSMPLPGTVTPNEQDAQ